MKEKIKILFIDDEEHNLESLRAAYRREWEVYTASNSSESDEILSTNPDIQIIMTDFKMPLKSGVEILEEYAEKYPHISRILITAYANTPLITSAVNKGKINYFLEKPWSNETIRQAVTSCFHIYKINQELKEKNELLGKAYEDLSRFIYSASHEMRSPLMTILGLIELAEIENPENSAADYFTYIKQSVEEIDNYLHGIIEYHKGNKKETHPVSINFEELIFEIRKEVKIDEKGTFTFSVQYEIGAMTTFKCDQALLKSLIENMLRAASKNTLKKTFKRENFISIYITPFEATIEINEQIDKSVFDFIETVFNEIYRIEDQGVDPINDDLMGIFFFKNALIKLGGFIKVKKTEKRVIYNVIIPTYKL